MSDVAVPNNSALAVAAARLESARHVDVTLARWLDLDNVRKRIPPALPTRARQFVAARWACATDVIDRTGAKQIVVLGAGLDTTAFTNPGRQVYEVDTPEMQRWKLDLFREARTPQPPNLTMISLDLEHGVGELSDRLVVSGLDPSLPTVCTILGLVSYLSRDALSTLLSVLCRSIPQCVVVIDYSESISPLSGDLHRISTKTFETFAEGGDTWTSFYTAEEFSTQVVATGLMVRSDKTLSKNGTLCDHEKTGGGSAAGHIAVLDSVACGRF